jgi:hypothetical protein
VELVRPIPVPDEAKVERPLAVARVFSAPDGDLTSDLLARPVELLADTIEDGDDRYRVLRIYLTPESDDVYVLQRGGWVELTLYGDSLPMFATQVWGGRLPQQQEASLLRVASQLTATYSRLAAEAEIETCPLRPELIAGAIDRLVADGALALPSTG